MLGACLQGLLLALAQDAAPARDAPLVDPRAVVERELASVRALVDRREWKSAAKSLAEFLHRHAGDDLVRAKRIEIEDLTRQASFWSRFPPPDPRDLVGGVLERFDRTSDAITLRYPSTRSAAAIKERAQARSQRPKISVPFLQDESGPLGSGPFPDFERQGALVLHPLQWNGPYAVEIRARVTSDRDPALVVVLALDDDEILVATLGVTCELSSVSSGVGRVLARKSAAPFELDRPYRLSVQVGEKTATVQVNGNVLLSGPKPLGSYGWFAFANVRNIESIVMRGKSYGQWIDALVDAAAAADRERFERKFRPREELPAWIFETRARPEVDKAGEKAARELVERGVKLERAGEIQGVLAKSKPAEALAFLDALPPEDLQPPSRAWLRAGVLIDLARLAEARAELAGVSAVAPLHRDVRRALARLALRLDPPAVALVEVERVVRDFPDDTPARELLVAARLQQGDMSGALSTAESVLLDGLDEHVAMRLVRRVRRALDGPAWRSRQTFESKHYVVASDMDRDTCAQIARVLEESHDVYAHVLAPLGVNRPRLRAFVFSGRQGYANYCQDLTGDARASTQGLFDLEAEQLILWSAVDRAEFTSTARHEGFHQYLHALVPEVPTWLSEGLAQYFETLRKDGSHWVQGDVPLGTAGTLRELSRCPDLDTLFRLDPGNFYGEHAPLWYAYAWCTVHTLAHGTDQDRAIFDGLLADLARGVDGFVAVREAFTGVDLTALEARVRAHANALAAR